MNQVLAKTIEKLPLATITTERKATLQVLVDYIQKKIKEGKPVQLNFICTHNSRRSQFAQIWAQAAADYFFVSARCYSGGVEVTAFNERAVATIERAGFGVGEDPPIRAEGVSNPLFMVYNSQNLVPILAFSKLHDDPTNPSDNFAAIMTCAHADENCPYIPGAEKRIPIRYDDPKAYDDTPLEAAKYEERSNEIGAEMFWVFEQVSTWVDLRD